MKPLIIGYEKAPKWLKIKYFEAVDYTCQGCNKHISEVGKLVPHRLIRGNQGGLYTLFPLNHPNNNVKILCRRCHFLYHQKEFVNKN